jgi:uncharacterized protein (DUF1330 family)
MTVYAIAQLKFTDRTAYDRYQARFMQVFTQFDGTVLAADEAPRVVEGSIGDSRNRLNTKIFRKTDVPVRIPSRSWSRD